VADHTSRTVRAWYRATETIHDEELAASVSLLSQDECARFQRFVFECDRREYAVAHALMRRALSDLAGGCPESWVFVKSPPSKPVLAHNVSPPLAFNLSHTKGMVACAVGTDVDIGIDVENVHRLETWSDIAEKSCAPIEMEALYSLPDAIRAERFLELWTLKEAFVKAIGVGLRYDLAAVTFDLSTDGLICFSPPSHLDRVGWQFELLAPTNRYRIALALRWPDTRMGHIVARSIIGDETLSPVRSSTPCGLRYANRP
jgi:4'-phosphopantetheinyl transferase